MLNLLDTAANIAMAMIILAMALNLVRLVRGPDATDRALALDALIVPCRRP